MKTNLISLKNLFLYLIILVANIINASQQQKQVERKLKDPKSTLIVDSCINIIKVSPDNRFIYVGCLNNHLLKYKIDSFFEDNPQKISETDEKEFIFGLTFNQELEL